MEYSTKNEAANMYGNSFPFANDTAVLPVGTVLASAQGSYQIGAPASLCASGILYNAMETTTQRRVMIQECFPYGSTREANGLDVHIEDNLEDDFRRGLSTFLQESELLQAQTDLPAIQKTMNCFRANGTAYRVLDFLDGKTLQTVLRENGGTLPAKKLLKQLEPVIRDLGILHRHGILHWDIRPENLVQLPDGSLKLCNFSSSWTPREHYFNPAADSRFWATEHYLHKGCGPWSDLYSLVAVLYTCTTGVLPPHSMDRLTSDELQYPTLLGADLTEEQEEALLWALSVWRTDRPESMEVFRKALYNRSNPVPTPAPALHPAFSGKRLVPVLSKVAFALASCGILAFTCFGSSF